MSWREMLGWALVAPLGIIFIISICFGIFALIWELTQISMLVYLVGAAILAFLIGGVILDMEYDKDGD